MAAVADSTHALYDCRIWMTQHSGAATKQAFNPQISQITRIISHRPVFAKRQLRRGRFHADRHRHCLQITQILKIINICPLEAPCFIRASQRQMKGMLPSARSASLR